MQLHGLIFNSELIYNIGELHCKSTSPSGPGSGPGSGAGWFGGRQPTDSSDVAKRLSEVGPIPLSNICPEFEGKEFTTTTWTGHTAKWRVRCDVWVSGHQRADINCYGGSVVQILQQAQENKLYRGLWWNHRGTCNELYPHWSDGYTGYRIEPYYKLRHGLVERVDYDES